MEGWAKIFAGYGSAAHSLAEQLDRSGVPVFERLEEAPRTTESGALPQTEVWVPEDERDHAQRLVEHWRTHHHVRVDGITGRLLRVFALSALVPILWIGGAWLAPERVPPTSVKGLGAAWVVALVLFAQIEHRRHHRERIDPWAAPPR
ncbi:MAG: hypothetical protein AAF430_04250 [Myxococcota bacterium]